MRQLIVLGIFILALFLGIYLVIGLTEIFQCFDELRHTPNYLVLHPEASITWECVKLHLLWPVGYFL